MLVNGRWVGRFSPLQKQAQEQDEQGGFVRKPSQFRHWVGVSDGYELEPGRYHLYVAMICPWACRTLMARTLKGLQDVVSVSRLSSVLTDQGWGFRGLGGESDPCLGSAYAHQLYSHADPEYNGRATVPILWDKQRQTIVNNESADIIRMLDQNFAPLATTDLQLRPAPLESQIDQLANYYYQNLNNGVYQAGFAQSQQAYQAAVVNVFEALDELESSLRHREYRLGVFTELDVRLFVTLVRFEPAYYSLFKCNLRRIDDYPNIQQYLKRIYQQPGIAETVDIDAIKRGYYSIKALNPSGVYPLGPKHFSFQQ